MKEYNNYIFDLYGTLIDIHTDEHSIQTWNKFKAILNQFKTNLSSLQLKEDYHSFIKKYEAKIAKNNEYREIDIKYVFKDILDKYNIEYDDYLIEKIAYEFRKASTSHIRLYSNVLDLLKLLKEKDKKIYLLSNAQSLFTFPEIQRFKIDKYFDDIFLSSDIGYKKPDIKFIKVLFDKYDLRKEECLFIGNDLYDDIGIGNKIGIDSYYIKDKLSSNRINKNHPTYFQDGMNINKLINNLNLNK